MMSERINTGVVRITRTSSLAFFSALIGVLMSVAILGAFLYVEVTGDGPWLTPQGTERSMGEVYAFAGTTALFPLALAAPVWFWAVSRWKMVLNDCYEANGSIQEISKPKPDIWNIRFNYLHDGVELDGRITVRPTPWVRALAEGEAVEILVSNKEALRALPRALFAARRPAPASGR